MSRRRFALALAVVSVGSMLAASPAAAARPERETDAYTVRFFDDLIWELCGIETTTTLTERWTFKAFSDGSTTLHVTRTFVPDDPRIPIEKGGATSHTAPDGTRTVTGVPLLLIGPNGRVTIAAGQTVFGEEITYHGTNPFDGQHPDDVDLSPYYCP